MFVTVACGNARADCVSHMRRSLPDLTIPLWYCERLPSRYESVLRPLGHAPRGREPVTLCECGAFVQGLTSPGGAFFRLLSLAHFGLISLKTGVLRQDRVWRIANRFGIHDLFIVHFPPIGLTQIAYAFGLRIHYHDVLIAMRFVLAPIV